MPIADTEAHHSTKRGDDYRYRCNNLPRTRNPLTVQDGWTEDGRKKTVEVDDFGSYECRHDKSLTDSACRGCMYAGTGEEYQREVEMRAAMSDRLRVGQASRV